MFSYLYALLLIGSSYLLKKFSVDLQLQNYAITTLMHNMKCLRTVKYIRVKYTFLRRIV